MVAQGIGLINTNPIHHLATESSHDVKEVIHYLSVRAMLPDFQIKRRIHVHGHGFDLLAPFRSQQLEEGTNRLAAVAFADPQDAHPVCIHDHGGVAMSLVQRKFIHDQTAEAVGDKLTVQLLQSAVIDFFDGVPVQAGQLGDMGNRQELGQRFDPGS